MLTNTSEEFVVSLFGWVDGGALWTYRVGEPRERHVPLGDAKYLTLHAGTGDHFSIVHHYDGARVEISVHHFDDVGAVLGRAVVDANQSSVTGPPSTWAHVQAHYTAYYTGPFWSAYALVRVDPTTAHVSLQQFEWYDDEYDKGYQGIVGVTDIPGDSLVPVAVQRDSRLVLYDPVAQTKRGIIPLAGRGGNPSLLVRRRAQEVWALDYDTVVKLDPVSWRVSSARRLQETNRQGANQFVGEFWFDHEETRCVVARPFSGDVVVLDPNDMKTRFHCTTGQQPLEAVVVAAGAVIARDWKTGALLRGELRKVRFFSRL